MRRPRGLQVTSTTVRYDHEHSDSDGDGDGDLAEDHDHNHGPGWTTEPTCRRPSAARLRIRRIVTLAIELPTGTANSLNRSLIAITGSEGSGAVPARHRRGGAQGAVVAASLFLLAALVVVWSGARTASARFSASTENTNSLFQTVAIDLDLTGSDGSAAVELLVDDDRVFPGRPIERCLQLTYSGTLDDARIRLHGHRGADTGLGDLVTVTFELGTGEATDCADFRTSERLYQGRSTDLTIDHGSFADGIDLSSHIGSGLTTTFRTIVEIDDDNAAQGLGTEFWIVIEARP